VVGRSSQLIQLGFVPSDSRNTSAPFGAEGQVSVAGWQQVVMNKVMLFYIFIYIYIKWYFMAL